MISKINIFRAVILIYSIYFLYSLIISPSFILLGYVIGSFSLLTSTYQFKSLYSYAYLWIGLLIQYSILIYVIYYSLYNFYELSGYLIIILTQTITYIFCQPMFSKLLFLITPFSSK